MRRYAKIKWFKERVMQEDITGKVAKALIELTGTGDVYKVVEADEILERLPEGDRPDKQTLGTAIRDLRGLGCIEVKYFTPDEYCLLVTRRAAELFSRLTGGRYDELAVSRDFSVLVKRAGDTVARGSLYLSAGAADLMYLAVRLAIAELVLPGDEPCPIILDDALAYLDPARRERVLALLEEIGEKRQVILFTCS